MQKTYKHKITGNIAVETISESNYKVSEPRNFTVPKWIVENSNDWEEIKEVKLEVPIGTKFRHKLSSNIAQIISYKDGMVNMDFLELTSIPVEKVNYYFSSGTWTIYKEKEFDVLETEYIPGKSGCNVCGERNPQYYENKKIIKVKRLNDKIIFKLGDLIKLKNGELKGILGFRIHNTFCQVELSSGKNVDYLANLSEIQPFNQPLFTDELGNEVYEGDKIYFVEIGEYLHKGCEIVNSYKNNYILDNDFKFFKNKADAEKYISDNKPTFSRKQILDILTEPTITNLWGYVDPYKFKQKLGL